MKAFVASLNQPASYHHAHHTQGSNTQSTRGLWSDAVSYAVSFVVSYGSGLSSIHLNAHLLQCALDVKCEKPKSSTGAARRFEVDEKRVRE